MSYTPRRRQPEPVRYKPGWARYGGYCVYCSAHAKHEVHVDDRLVVRICGNNGCKARFWMDNAY